MKAVRPDPRTGVVRIRPMLVFGVAVAAGWWALAESPASRPGAIESVPARAEVPAERPAQGGARAPMPPPDPPARTGPALAAGPFPYAAGGDDLLPTSGPAPAPSDRPTLHESPSTAAGSAARAPTAERAGSALRGRVAVARSDQGPSLLLWLERDRAAVGERVGVHIASALARRCATQGLLEGEVAPNATLQVAASVPGWHRLRVTCSGDGGAVTRDVTLRVPLPVDPDSTRNRRLATASGMPWTRIGELAPAARVALPADIDDGPVAAGDFFQEGRHAIFAAGARAGRLEARFLGTDGNGRWIDRSAELLADGDATAACARPTVALIADFNGDAKPDVWLGCGPCGDDADRRDCRPLLYLSQADGRYRRVPCAYALQATAVEARDVDGDGWVDMLVVDSADAAVPRTKMLLGRGDGGFVLAALTAAGTR